MSTEVKTRSPLKVPPLRNPGQSLDEELQQLYVDKLLPYFLYPPLFIAYALGEWWRWYRPSLPHPWFMTMLALVSVTYSVYQVRKLLPKIHAVKLGRDGEKVVGQALEDLRTGGAIVLHDITADGFNVDHVVISNQGIFVIETKTNSKPNGKDAKVVFDGEKITVGGWTPSRDPIKQVQANAAWVRDLLKESTGKSFPVKPVVLFPGWFIETVGPHAHDRVWVLNPKGLPAFMAKEKSVLTLEDVKMATCHLSRYIRSLR
jgi:Nuclease-related domain